MDLVVTFLVIAFFVWLLKKLRIDLV